MAVPAIFEQLAERLPDGAYKTVNVRGGYTSIDAYHIVEKLTDTFEGICGHRFGIGDTGFAFVAVVMLCGGDDPLGSSLDLHDGGLLCSRCSHHRKQYTLSLALSSHVLTTCKVPAQQGYFAAPILRDYVQHGPAVR